MCRSFSSLGAFIHALHSLLSRAVFYSVSWALFSLVPQRYNRRPLRLNVTICANVHIHCSYLNIQLISQTAISLYACCTKMHRLIRLAYPSLYRNILLILIYNIFDITFLLVCRIIPMYKPAFCHAFIKRLIDRRLSPSLRTHEYKPINSDIIKTYANLRMKLLVRRQTVRLLRVTDDSMLSAIRPGMKSLS